MNNIGKSVADKLMRYVRVDTQSDPESSTFPSTEKQKDLSRMLVEELKNMGVARNTGETLRAAVTRARHSEHYSERANALADALARAEAALYQR